MFWILKTLLLTAIVLASNAVSSSYAQTTTATISGVVKDERAAVLPGVTITVKSLETAITRTFLTQEEGTYRVTNLALGDYEVQAELPGFQTAIRTGIHLTIGREAIVDFALKIGEISERVTVTGEAPLVDVVSSTLGELVDERKIQDLPLNGRSFQQLGLLQPGALFVAKARDETSKGVGIKISAGGARFTFNQFLLDGGEINDARNQTPASVLGNLLGIETIREFKVMTSNYSAEYGRNAGALISVATKSGTNDLHGALFEFHRNSALDARNFFDGRQPPPFKRNQFGFMLSGPIKKNRTFFLGSYEGLRDRLGITQIARVPDTNARAGILPGRAPIAVAPEAKPYLALYPLPNGRDFGNGVGELISNSTQPGTEDYFSVRIDHQLSDSDSLFVRYTFDNARKVRTDPIPATTLSVPRSRSQWVSIQETKIFTPNLINVFRFGLNRSLVIEGQESLIDSSFAFVPSPGRTFGQIAVVGLNTLVGVGGTRLDIGTVFDYSDTLDYTRGRHSIKAGFNIKRFQVALDRGTRVGGIYSFDSLADFLRGVPAEFGGQQLLAQFSRARGVRETMFGVFIQDDFKVTPRFTANLGLRYEFITVPREIHGKESNLRSLDDPAPTVGPLFRNPSLKNFGPRLGFAWDLLGDAKTALRGGFGIFYDQIIPGRGPDFPFTGMPPFHQDLVMSNPTFPHPDLGLIRTVPLAQLVLNTIDFNLSTPYMMQYNLALQRELVSEMVLTAAYSGSRGVHLTAGRGPNIPIPEILSDGRQFFRAGLPRRNPGIGRVSQATSDIMSFYNSVQLGLNKRLGRGLQVQGSYTLSRSIDEQSDVVSQAFVGGSRGLQDPFDRKGQRGLSDFHVRHNFVFNYTYNIPFGQGWTGLAGKLASGWQVAGITAISSGNPFYIELGFDRSRTGERDAQRPNLKPGRSNNPILGGPDQYFDFTAFELQPAGFYGNLGRHTTIGPGLVNSDFSLVKSTLIHGLSESFNVQFRAEFFNVFNRANFAAATEPGGVQILNSQGQYLPAGASLRKTVTTSRQIQFGLKLTF